MIELAELTHHLFFWVDTLVAFAAAFMLYVHLTWGYLSWIAEFEKYSWQGRMSAVCGILVSGYCLLIYNSLYGEAYREWLSMIF